MIPDFTAPAKAEEQALIDAIWSHIPSEVAPPDALRVAQTAIEILAAPSDAEFERLAKRALYPALGIGLLLTIAYALIGAPWLAWAAAEAWVAAFGMYVTYLLLTEPA